MDTGETVFRDWRQSEQSSHHSHNHTLSRLDSYHSKGRILVRRHNDYRCTASACSSSALYGQSGCEAPTNEKSLAPQARLSLIRTNYHNIE